MNVRRSFVQAVALAVVVAMPVMGLSGVASAKATKATKGSAAWCKKHHKNALCQSGSGGGNGQGAGTPPITVTALSGIIQIEANPSFAGDTVDVYSTQLQASCGGTVVFLSVEGGSLQPSYNHYDAVLDDDGNATVIMEGAGNCAPGDNIVDASLVVAPYYTALTDYQNTPDVVTPPALYLLPVEEVETGDSSTSGDSDVYGVYALETNPVYAEQTAEFSDTQLESSCGGGWYYIGAGGPEPSAGPVGPGVAQQTTAGDPATAEIDDDGNAGVIFIGISCAATTTTAIADVDAGDHPTYVTEFTVLAPQVT